MFTGFDKAWLAGFVGAVLVTVAETLTSPDVSPIDALMDPQTWVTAIAMAVMVYFVPNAKPPAPSV